MSDTITVITKRPRDNDPSVMRNAAESMLASVIQWLKAGDDDTSDEKSILDDLVNAASFDRDGYKICTSLERAGWYPDAELVDIMDMFTFKLHSAHRDAVKAWVEENKTVPLYAVGDIVRYKPANHPEATGQIVRMDLEQAIYYIGDEKNSYLIPYESVLGKV